jgi:hypothetical protein
MEAPSLAVGEARIGHGGLGDEENPNSIRLQQDNLGMPRAVCLYLLYAPRMQGCWPESLLDFINKLTEDGFPNKASVVDSDFSKKE